MVKQIIVTGLGNRIKYATTNGEGTITGKTEDITDSCVDAVFQHLMIEYKRELKKGNEIKEYGFEYKGLGKLLYIPKED